VRTKVAVRADFTPNEEKADFDAFHTEKFALPFSEFTHGCHLVFRHGHIREQQRKN